MYSTIPLEIKSSIIDQLDDAELGTMALVWPETLSSIRRRTFDSVVISHHAHHCEDHADEAYRRIQSSLCNLQTLLERTPDIARCIRILHLREGTFGRVSRFPISRLDNLSEFLKFIPEMKNLESFVLEGLNFWMMDPKALTRALRRCTFSLHTLQLKACVLPMDILVAILRAVVDVHLLDLGTLQFDRFEDWAPYDGLTGGEFLLFINGTSHPLIDFDDPAAWKRALRPPEDREFFCADTLRLHIMSPADHRFVDFLASEKYSPICDLRALEILSMGGWSNVIQRLNKLLARMGKYLEELTIFQARVPGKAINRFMIHGVVRSRGVAHLVLDDDVFIDLSYISTFRFWTHIKCSTSQVGPDVVARWAWPNALEIYTSALHGLSETTKLRHVEVNLLLDVDMQQEMIYGATSIIGWIPLDAALTSSVLTRSLEVLVLNVFLMDDLEHDDSEVARLEGWILNDCLPATRRVYFESDERGVIFCEKRSRSSDT